MSLAQNQEPWFILTSEEEQLWRQCAWFIHEPDVGDEPISVFLGITSNGVPMPDLASACGCTLNDPRPTYLNSLDLSKYDYAYFVWICKCQTYARCGEGLGVRRTLEDDAPPRSARGLANSRLVVRELVALHTSVHESEELVANQLAQQGSYSSGNRGGGTMSYLFSLFGGTALPAWDSCYWCVFYSQVGNVDWEEKKISVLPDQHLQRLKELAALTFPDPWIHNPQDPRVWSSDSPCLGCVHVFYLRHGARLVLSGKRGCYEDLFAERKHVNTMFIVMCSADCEEDVSHDSILQNHADTGMLRFVYNDTQELSKPLNNLSSSSSWKLVYAEPYWKQKTFLLDPCTMCDAEYRSRWKLQREGNAVVIDSSPCHLLERGDVVISISGRRVFSSASADILLQCLVTRTTWCDIIVMRPQLVGTWYYNQGANCYTITEADYGYLYYEKCIDGRENRGLLTKNGCSYENDLFAGSCYQADLFTMGNQRSGIIRISKARLTGKLISVYKKEGHVEWFKPVVASRKQTHVRSG